MRTGMDCRRAEELLSDHLEGTLSGPLARDFEAHIRECASCAEMRDAMGEVVEALRAFPALEPARDLAERAAARGLRGRHPVGAPRPALPARPPRGHGRFFVPSWLQAAAAGFVLVITGTLLLVAGPDGPSRTATRLVDRTVTTGSYLLERSDRLVEDVRILGVVIATAFEGRLDRVNDRMDDYRKRLQRRRSTDEDSKKRESGGRMPSLLSAEGFRTASPGET
jgi:putative zinc finger protein